MASEHLQRRIAQLARDQGHVEPRQVAGDAGPLAVAFSLRVPPSANRYWRTDQEHGTTYVSTEGRHYREHVANVGLLQRARPLDGDVVLAFVWYRARRAGDLDNRHKVLFDALAGVAYHDDKQIAAIQAFRDDTDPTHPRVDVVVARAPDCITPPDVWRAAFPHAAPLTL